MEDRPIIKPLTWVYLPTPPDGEYYAPGPIGPYYIERSFVNMNTCVWYLKHVRYIIGKPHETLDSAKGAAQKHAQTTLDIILRDWIVEEN